MDISEQNAQPVTVVFTWDVVPGREAEFESWAHGINETATGYPGHLGATWLRAEGSRHRYYTILHFVDQERLSGWMDSDERAGLAPAPGGRRQGAPEPHHGHGDVVQPPR